jgi:hypothetical protein
VFDVPTLLSHGPLSSSLLGNYGPLVPLRLSGSRQKQATICTSASELLASVRAALIQINGWPTPLRSHARLGLWATDMMAQRTVVIVVDDDPRLLKRVAQLLAHHGIDSRTFSSAEALLECEGVQKASCLLLDIHLGAFRGLSCSVGLRHQDRSGRSSS